MLSHELFLSLMWCANAQVYDTATCDARVERGRASTGAMRKPHTCKCSCLLSRLLPCWPCHPIAAHYELDCGALTQPRNWAIVLALPAPRVEPCVLALSLDMNVAAGAYAICSMPGEPGPHGVHCACHVSPPPARVDMPPMLNRRPFTAPATFGVQRHI